MTKTVKGAGRGRYSANKARHDQRTPLPPRGSEPVRDRHDEVLREILRGEGSAPPELEV